MSDLVNSFIGDYRLVEFLGAGGMGEVYRAIHSRIGREVAVKVLMVSSRDDGFGERFLNEARIQAELQHPNIATLYEFTETAGRPCIIMEYVDGQTLADRIRAFGRLPPAEATAILRPIAEAVVYIHANGVVHRDLKSNNVKISSTGKIKLLDFGIAKRGTSPRLTLDGHFVGTLHYCSPEQLQGRAVDDRSDIWALGVLLYEMLSGQVPFDADSAHEFARMVESGRFSPASELVPDVPSGLDGIISRCLQTRPERRFQSSTELVAALNQLSGSQPARDLDSALPEGMVELFGRIPLWVRDHLPLVAGGAALSALLVLVLLLTVGGNGSDLAGQADSVRGRPTPAAKGDRSGKVPVSIGMVGGTADIFVDGRRVGRSPCSFDAVVGHRIDIELRVAGHQTLRKRIQVLPHSNRYTYSIRDFRRE